MRGRYKKWALPYLGEHPEVVLPSIDWENPFFKGAEHLSFEVGAGKGDFVLGMARLYPDRRFLAIERDVSVAGILAKKVVESGLTNIRIMNEDFDELQESLLPERFDIIYLNFSDPWPKKRHEKRRLTTANRLNKMAELLKNGGEIRFKSDNDILYAFTEEQLPEVKLNLVADIAEYAFDPSDDAMSEYERNFRGEGKPIHRIILKKGE